MKKSVISLLACLLLALTLLCVPALADETPQTAELPPAAEETTTQGAPDAAQTDEAEAPASDGSSETGWYLNGRGEYQYIVGESAQGGWLSWGGAWYYLSQGETEGFNHCEMLHDVWLDWEGARYYFAHSGKMVSSKWVEDKTTGAWYYCMANGKAATGWQKLGGFWYFFCDERENETYAYGQMVSNVILSFDDGKLYFFKENGKMASGWTQIGDEWFYFSGGAIKTGWLQSGDSWYYLMKAEDLKPEYADLAGIMARGVSCVIGGKEYYFKESGKMATGWQSFGEDWYYYGSNGVLRTGWVKSGGSWYYLMTAEDLGEENADYAGLMAKGGWLTIDGTEYYFLENGKMATYWQKLGENWVYFFSSGVMARNKWVKSGGYWYYLSGSGVMLSNGVYEISHEGPGSDYYYFYPSGKMASSQWVKLPNSDGKLEWYYFGASGKPYSGFMWQNGKLYYLKTGYMYYSTKCMINYFTYQFGADGSVIRQWDISGKLMSRFVY